MKALIFVLSLLLLLDIVQVGKPAMAADWLPRAS